MTPPYKLVDMATGEEVFVGMDTEPGRYIEVYSGSGEGVPDTRISPGAVIRPNDVPDPPDPEPEPPVNGMDYPKNEDELRTLMQGYADAGIVGILDPRTKIDMSRPLWVRQHSASGTPWGVNGNYAKLSYKGHGEDMFIFEGVQGQNNRGLTIKNLVFDGGDGGNMSGGGAATCLKLSAPLGDNGPLYKFHIENVFCSGAVNGLILEGGVYEGEVRTIHVENCTGDGIILRHLPAGDGAQGPVVSNIKFYHVNSSRNFGAGLRTVYSVYIYGASFVLNGGGGIVAPDGLRGAFGINGENTGGANQCVVDIPSNGYGSVVEVGEASSDGATHCRRWTGTEWVSVGKPLLYFAAIGQGVQILNSHCSYYGSGQNPMRVVK